ncbi:MAG TPA: hypothetical protein VFD97_02740 [Acidimicrobiia bacterium]|nr:hypothetical protein [Acidimicrobiia bacterium]
MRSSEIPAEIVSTGHFLTRAQAANAAHVSGHVMATMNGMLRLGGRYAIQECYPAFMFRDKDHLEAFRDVVGRFNGDDSWLVLGWLNQGRSELGGRSPAAWIDEGRDPDRITHMADQAAG